MSRPTILISALFFFTLLASLFGQSLLEENFDYPALIIRAIRCPESAMPLILLIMVTRNSAIIS